MANPKTIWMVSGNKGGVGKSLACLALASALDFRGQAYAVMDGDGRTGDVYAAFTRKVPAKWGDFRDLRPDSHLCIRDAEYEKSLHQLLRSSNDLIVNTPDGADSLLMKWFDVTLKHTESNNYQFKFIYMMSDRPDGLDLIPELVDRFQFFYPVRNLHFGKPADFSKFNKDFSGKFHGVVDFPILRSEEVRVIFDSKTYPSEVLSILRAKTKSYKYSSLTRSRILAWQKKINDECFCGMFNDDDIPNVKCGAW